ncbi:hypothetical protein BDR03DRAFT_976861 [Suillus americanus]|nr:hypothetical protein BDR03DRAFT_976861 [Suillus americanus]
MANLQESAATFDFDDRLGLVFIVEAATLSVLAITALLAYITYSAVTIRMGATRRWSTDTHVHYYFLNLMLFDLIQAIGGMFDIVWIDAAGIYPGTVLVLRWSSPPKAALLGSAIIWVIVGLMVGIPNILIDNFYGPTGHWCWIEHNNFQRMGLQYMWMWLAAFITIVVYIFLALVVKRIISVDGYKIRWTSPETRSVTPSDGSDPRQRGDEGAIALRMLFHWTVPNFYSSSYPAVYIVTVLPITAARFTQFHTQKVPWGVTAWADTLLLLSGFFNTILYTLTRPKLLPHRRRSHSRVVLTSTGSNQQFGRTDRFQNHKHYPFDTKTEEGELPAMSFELGEPQRSSSELRFAHPVISNIEQ